MDFVDWREFLRMARALDSLEGWLGERVSSVSATKRMMKLAEDKRCVWKALTTCLEPSCHETSEPVPTQSWWQKGRCVKVSPECESGPVVSALHQCQFVFSGALAVGLPSITEDGQFWLVLSSSFMEPMQLHFFTPIREGTAIAEVALDVNVGRAELRVDFAEGDDVVGVLRDIWTATSTNSQPATCLVALSNIADDIDGSVACSGFIPWKAGPPRVRLHAVSELRSGT